MKMKSLLLLALVATSAMATAQPSNLEQVIDQARKKGATIVECTGGICYERGTYKNIPNARDYEGSPDGVYVEYKGPTDEAIELMDEAARITRESQESEKQ